MKNYILLFAVVSATLFFGCNSKTETTNTAVNTVAVNAPVNSAVNTEPEIDISQPFKPSENPKDDLLNSTKRLQGHDAWSATLENDAMPDFKTDLDYVAPDRYRIKNAGSEIVVIGNAAYAKQEGKWQKLPEDIGAQINEMKKNFNAKGMEAVKEVKKTSGEKVGGKDATVYTYIIEPTEKTVGSFTDVWIADDSGLPLKIVVKTENGGRKQKVTTIYDYSKPVKIEAPEIK